MNQYQRHTMVCIITFFLLASSIGMAGEGSPSLKELQQQAEQGIAEAQVNLGLKYRRGRDVTRDYWKARTWFHKAAEQGHADAQNNLGQMYDHGRGVEQDFVQARKWYRMAAEQGHANAQYNLALLYANGQGVPQDDIEAYAWANISAAQGKFTPSIELRDKLRKILGPDCISRAQAQSKEYFQKYVVPFQ